MNANKRLPPLDGLRALMIFIVSWYHIWQQSWLQPMIGSYSLDYLVRSGYVWVDGTVLLSAFLLFLPYARAGKEGPMPDVREFYYRRARRILPSYYFILLVTFFGICLPWRLYANGPYLVKDLATHFSFTFPFFYDTYVATPLGAAAWTLAIEVQAYVLFPWVARAVVKKPAGTLAILALLCFGFRAWCLWGLTEYNMVVNQLINFLDVYVLGILGSMAFVRLEALRDRAGRRGRTALTLGATVLLAAAVFGLTRLLQFQASSSSVPQIQSRQMMFRPAYGLCFLGMVLGSLFSVRPIQLLLGNPVTRFLSAVSMNYYLVHQIIIVHMKRLRFPSSVSDLPNQAGEQPWQNQYTFWAFALSLALAAGITWGIEKPAARLMDRRRAKKASP